MQYLKKFWQKLNSFLLFRILVSFVILAVSLVSILWFLQWIAPAAPYMLMIAACILAVHLVYDAIYGKG